MKRIDGRRLAQNIGEQVVLLGTVTKKSTNGKSFELTTTDGIQVNIALNEPIDDNIEDYLEVRGTVQSKGTMSCNRYINFPSSMTNNFNVQQYNSLLTILHVLGEKKLKL